MIMRISDDGLYAMALHEGVVPAPYLDSVGVWTLGIGHTSGAGEPDPADLPKGMPADMDRALRRVFDLFRHDVQKYEAAVRRAVRVPVTQAEFDALVSFHYNTGAIDRATLVKKLNAGDRAGAAAGFMSWVKPPEIRKRREAERDLFATGVYPVGRVNVWGATSAGKVIWKPVRTLNMAEFMALLGADSAPPVRPDAPVAAPAPPVASNGFWRAILALLARIFGGKR